MVSAQQEVVDLDRAIFLVVDGARSQAAARAWERFSDPAVTDVALYYRDATDVALVAVELATGAGRGRWIGRVVASGLAVIDPARMSEGDRRAFLATYLRGYELRGGAIDVAAAMAVLAPAPTPPLEALPRSRRLGSDPAPPALPPVPTPGLGRLTARGLGALREPGDVPELPPLRPPAVAAGERRRAPTVDLRGPVSTSTPRERDELRVRFVRGGHWAPARLRALSARGAYLVTGAPPRGDDDVHVAIDLGERSALVRGRVYHVTSPRDAAVTGSAGFAVRFDPTPSAARSRLLELLHVARDAGVVIRPPPARASMRFPVRWSIGLGAAPVDALDVSRGGVFVAAAGLAVDRTVHLEVPLDDGGAPLVVDARVARLVTDEQARARGLVAGAGLCFAELPETERIRWARFLARVERRASATVVVGAGLPRLDAIARALTDAGYAVAPCGDPGALLRVAEAATAPDAALIDHTMLDGGVATQWLEQLFSARQVPCVTLRGEVGRARLVVDRLLAVAG